MKRKILSLLLCLALGLSLLPTALAAPVTEFTDVPAGSWFEEGVALCAEKGVMIGTNADAFSPERKLTRDECLTLAFRLYDLIRGQEHIIEKAPEAEGKITLTLADGTVFEGYASRDHRSTFFYWSGNGRNAEGLCVEVPGYSDWRTGVKAQTEWLDAHPDIQGRDRPATLTLNGITYQGTTICWLPAGPLVFMFQPEPGKAEEVNSILRQAVYQGANPELWWWDTAYTITQRGLGSIFNPAYFTDDPASRGFFARLIAAACEGHLEKLNTVEAIPDLSREKSNTSTDAYREAAYTLYEAGILTGVDEAGTFAADATLTRAEAAVMAARALDEGQRVSAPAQGGTSQTAEPLYTKKFDSYDQAVADLRGSWGYRNEQTIEAPDCTIFVYDPGGIMLHPTGAIRLVYKAGSIPGEGTVIAPPYARTQRAVISYPADTMTLSEDGKTFTYTYYRPEDILDIEEKEVQAAAGQVTYTVDLPTGEVYERFSPPSYEGAMAHVTRKRINTPRENSMNREVVESLESEFCTVVLTRGQYAYGEKYDDYILSLVYKPGSALGDGTIRRLILPSTVYSGYSYDPTDRAPDSLTLSEDGTTLTYVYHFDEALEDFHEAGTYTYTVDLATGDLNVSFEDPYEVALSHVFGIDSFQLDQQIEMEPCTILVGTGKILTYKRAVIALVYKPGSLPGAGKTVWLRVAADDTLYGSILPDAMELSQDGGTLTYTYHFSEDGYTYDSRLTHKAGTHTYTVDLNTGEYEYVHTAD